MQISIVNLEATPQVIDVKLGERRHLRLELAIGETKNVSSLVTLDEIDMNSALQALISAGSIRLSITDGPIEVIRKVFTAAATGAADDVTVDASLAHGYRILDAYVIVSDEKSSETVTLRTATGGSGTALTSALSVNAQGTIRSNITAETVTVNAGSALYLRRSDRDCGGELVIVAQRTT